MTDIKDRFASLLADEPPQPDSLSAVLADGRRASRRRTATVAVAGGAGAAMVTAAVVTPLVVFQGSSPGTVAIGPGTGGEPAAAQPTHGCTVEVARHGKSLEDVKRLVGHGRGIPADAKWVRIVTLKSPTRGFEVCWVRRTGPTTSTPSPTTPTGPAYHYTKSPETIAADLADELHAQLIALGFTPPAAQPFAQESSKLEKGHPSYYDGYVDVTYGGHTGNVGVQVNHVTTAQQADPNDCAHNPYGKTSVDCQTTTLPDGSVVQTSKLTVGKGKALLEADLERLDGVNVIAQETDYGFQSGGDEKFAPQPLTLAQLTKLVEDKAFTF